MLGLFRKRRLQRGRVRAVAMPEPTTPFDKMWLNLDDDAPEGPSGVRGGTSICVSRRWAYTASVEDFAELYLGSVIGSKRREGLAWGRRQVETRDTVLSA